MELMIDVCLLGLDFRCNVVMQELGVKKLPHCVFGLDHDEMRSSEKNPEIILTR